MGLLLDVIALIFALFGLWSEGQDISTTLETLWLVLSLLSLTIGIGGLLFDSTSRDTAIDKWSYFILILIGIYILLGSNFRFGIFYVIIIFFLTIYRIKY